MSREAQLAVGERLGDFGFRLNLPGRTQASPKRLIGLRRAQEVDLLRRNESFAGLYRDYRRGVEAFLARRASWASRQDLEDMRQEVFLRAWMHRHRFEGHASARTFLLAIAKNVLLEHCAQAKRRQRRPELRSTEGEAVHRLDIEELFDKVMRAVTSLSRRQQEALRLVLIEGRSLHEAADLTATKYEVIKRRLSAAKQRLRRATIHCEGCTSDSPIPKWCPENSGRARCYRFLWLTSCAKCRRH